MHPLGAAQHHGPAVAGVAAEDREKAKSHQYGADCLAAGWDFVPLAGESTGAWGRKTQTFVSALVRKLARTTGDKIAAVSASLWGELSFALARASASMLVQASQRVPPAADGPRKPERTLPVPSTSPPACAVSLPCASRRGGESLQGSSVRGTPAAARGSGVPDLEVCHHEPVVAAATAVTETFELGCRLPSGSCLPLQVIVTEAVGAAKARVLAHCGLDAALAPGLGLALGFAALDDARSWRGNDVQAGDVVALFQRTGDAPAAVRAREVASAGL